MTAPLVRHVRSGIECLELELIVRDFIAVLDDGSAADLCAFLTEDVIYRGSPTQILTGRRAVLQMIADIRATCLQWQSSLIDVAVTVTDGVVLSERAIHLRLPRSEPQLITSLDTFRMSGFRIATWHHVRTRTQPATGTNR
jgi:limonene-1,2-epoxide hydrolase